MSIDNLKDWVDILKAFLTPTIALFGIFIGFMQWWTNHKKLKIEYFNQRIAVFDAIGKYIAEILISGGIDNNAETKFLRDTRNVFFLFGNDNDIKALVDEMYKKSTDLHALQAMGKNLSGQHLEMNLNKQGEIKDWLKKELNGLQKRFKKHLSL